MEAKSAARSKVLDERNPFETQKSRVLIFHATSQGIPCSINCNYRVLRVPDLNLLADHLAGADFARTAVFGGLLSPDVPS